MRKNITIEQVELAFEAANEVGLESYGNFIFGDLEEDEKTISNSLSWKLAHRDYNIRIGWILTFPGSFLYKTAVRKNIIADPVKYLKDGCPQTNVSKMSNETYWDIIKRVELFKLLYEMSLFNDNTHSEFNIYSINLNEQKTKLNSLLNGNKVCVWPSTLRSMELLKSISQEFVSSDDVILINRDPDDVLVRGMERFNKPVYTPDILNELKIETVLYPYGSQSVINVYAQISELIRNKYPSVKHFIRITDLLK